MTTPTFLIKPISAGIFWGLAGGLSLILITLVSNKGLIQIIPYPLILISAMLFFKYKDSSEKVFFKMFTTALLSFIVMSVILSVYVQAFVNPVFNFNLKGLLWTLAAITGIGSISSLLVSIIAKPVRR